MSTSELRAWVEVDLGALVRNGQALADRAGVPLLPMLKADGYGLGAVALARALERLDPWGYGVATIEEGEALRSGGIERPVLVFTPLLPHESARAHAARLTPTLGRPEMIDAWGRTSRGGPWHLAIDTGMSRSGVKWNAMQTVADAVARFPPTGACTHFLSAEGQDGSREGQEKRFREALNGLARRPSLVHAENSPAIERLQTRSMFTLVRPGVYLYGVASGGGSGSPRDAGPRPPLVPEPVVAVRARVVDLRTIEAGETVSYGGTYVAPSVRRIATLPLGYGDGYRRAFGNNGRAVIRGAEVPVVGVVTMDMVMLDVTDVDCAIGDVATVIGRGAAGPPGHLGIDLVDAARRADIFPYELLTGLRLRLPRVYVAPPAA